MRPSFKQLMEAIKLQNLVLLILDTDVRQASWRGALVTDRKELVEVVKGEGNLVDSDHKAIAFKFLRGRRTVSSRRKTLNFS